MYASDLNNSFLLGIDSSHDIGSPLALPPLPFFRNNPAFLFHLYNDQPFVHGSPRSVHRRANIHLFPVVAHFAPLKEALPC